MGEAEGVGVWQGDSGLEPGEEPVIYAFPEIERQVGELAIVSDVVGALPVVVAYDGRSETAVVFSRLIDGAEHTFALE